MIVSELFDHNRSVHDNTLITFQSWIKLDRKESISKNGT